MAKDITQALIFIVMVMRGKIDTGKDFHTLFGIICQLCTYRVCKLCKYIVLGLGPGTQAVALLAWKYFAVACETFLPVKSSKVKSSSRWSPKQKLF